MWRRPGSERICGEKCEIDGKGKNAMCGSIGRDLVGDQCLTEACVSPPLYATLNGGNLLDICDASCLYDGRLGTG